MIHLYAFALDVSSLDAVAGIGGARLETITVDERCCAVVSEGDAGETHDAVLAHGAVVDAVAERSAAVLPVRFGERFDTAESMRAAIAARLPQLLDRLERLRGCVELGVRIGFPSERAADLGDGSEYIRTRAAHAAQIAAAVARLEGDLRALSEDSVVPRLAVDESAYHAAFLVRREAAPAFVSAVDGFALDHRDASVLCTGPWPPYTFAEAA